MPATLKIDPSSIQIQTTSPSPEVSARYSFLPTSMVMDTMFSQGWNYDGGSARAVRNPLMRPYAFHVLRFSHPKLPKLPNGVFPQAVVQNGHNAGHAFRIDFGLFRVACANGMIVQSANVGGIRRVHLGYTTDALKGDLDQLLEHASTAFDGVRRWSEIQTSQSNRLALARRIGLLRWPAGNFAAHDLLSPRRCEDESDDLWTVFNRIQEGIIRGGCMVSRDLGEGRRVWTKSRAIRGVLSDLELNRAMWKACETLADEIERN